MAMASDSGIALGAQTALATAAWLFGEDQARYLIATPDAAKLLKAAAKAGVPAAIAGRVEGDALSADGLFAIPLTKLRQVNEAFLPNLMGA